MNANRLALGSFSVGGLTRNNSAWMILYGELYANHRCNRNDTSPRIGLCPLRLADTKDKGVAELRNEGVI
jgi:hypothetical protein